MYLSISDSHIIKDVLYFIFSFKNAKQVLHM